MKKAVILFTAVLLINSNITAQADSLYILNFQTDLVNNYSRISKISTENYFQILSKAAEYTFDIQNPNYQKALLQISKSQNVNESKALEKLFEKTFTVLRKDHLWDSATAVSSSDRQLLDVYNQSLCPCITSKVSKQSPMEAVLKAQQACVVSMISDTGFLNGLKRVGGNNTLNDLYRLQRYLALLMYEKCDLYNYKLNHTIFDNSVLINYYQGISDRRRSESMNVLKLFEENRTDSLKLIFPSYAKYIPQLKEAVKTKNIKKNTADAYYHNGNMGNAKPIAVVDIHNKDLVGIQLSFTFSENALSAQITSAQIERFQASKEDQIMEIREQRVIQAPIKN